MSLVSPKQPEQPRRTGLFHTVFFWLREGGDASDARRIAQGCEKHLANIPGIVRLTVGRPAGTNRSVVDNTYGVALLVEFTDAAANDVYENHPDHLRFIEECSPFWSRVQVYDTLPFPD